MSSKARHPRPDVETRPLDPDEIAEILLSVDIDDVILVGGQALNAWAEDLSSAAGPDLDRYGPYTSFDLDLIGPKATAKKFAARINGRVKLATLEACRDGQRGDGHLRAQRPHDRRRLPRWAVWSVARPDRGGRNGSTRHPPQGDINGRERPASASRP